MYNKYVYSRVYISCIFVTLVIARAKRETKLDLVSRVTGIPGRYWILGIKCSDNTGVGLVY